MIETGIFSIHKKHHIVSKPNCKPVREKGRPLALEKIASIFVFYIIGCIVSLIVLVMENIFGPKSTLWSHHALASAKTNEYETAMSKKIDVILKELNTFTNDKEMKLFLLDEIKSIVCHDNWFDK